MLGGNTAGSSPETGTPSWQSHPRLCAGARACPSQKQKEPQPGGGVEGSAHTRAWFRGVPQTPPPKTFHTSPGQISSPSWWGTVTPSSQHINSHAQGHGCHWGCFHGGFAGQPFTTTLPSSSTSLGFAATAQEEAAPSPI